MEESDSFKKDLFKRDIFETISEELIQKNQSSSPKNDTPDKNDFNKILAKLKQSIEQIEGNLNGEANDILKELSVVLSEKEDKNESVSVPPMLVRQDTYIISTDERLFGGRFIPETIEEDHPQLQRGHSLYEKLTDAFENFDIKNKVIVVVVEPECKHGKYFSV